MSRRQNRIEQFRRQAGAGWYDTSLCPAGAHRPRDSGAIAHWRLVEATARPKCFACANPFSIERRPAAFLTARASRAPDGSVAVAALCITCWTMPASEIETAAAELLRRQLCRHGNFLDQGV